MAAPAVALDLGSLSAKPAAAASQTTGPIGASSSGTNSVVVVVGMRAASSGAGTGITLTDSAGNTYTPIVFQGGSTVAAAQIAILLCQTLSNPIVSGTTTFTIGSTSQTFTAYDLHLFQLDSIVQDAGFDHTTAGSGTSNPNINSGATTAGDYLWVGAHAAVLPNTSTDTISSTGYTLVPAGTAMEGTTGSTSTTNLAMKVGYDSAPGWGTTAANFNGTLSATANWRSAIVALKVVAATATSVTASDSVTVASSVTTSLAHPRSLGDTVALSDAAAGTTARSRSVADSVSEGDAATAHAGKQRTTGDTTSVSDAANRTDAATRTVGDTVSESDAAAGSSAQSRNIADTISPSDQAASASANSRALSDTATLSDNANSLTSLPRTATDSTAIADAATQSTSSTRDTTASVAASDTASAHTATSPFVADAVTIGDSATGQVPISAPDFDLPLTLTVRGQTATLTTRLGTTLKVRGASTLSVRSVTATLAVKQDTRQLVTRPGGVTLAAQPKQEELAVDG